MTQQAKQGMGSTLKFKPKVLGFAKVNIFRSLLPNSVRLQFSSDYIRHISQFMLQIVTKYDVLAPGELTK